MVCDLSSDFHAVAGFYEISVIANDSVGTKRWLKILSQSVRNTASGISVRCACAVPVASISRSVAVLISAGVQSAHLEMVWEGPEIPCSTLFVYYHIK